MADTSKNLTLHRSQVSVWDRPGWTPGSTAWDRERLIMGAWGGALALYGLKRGGWLGLPLALAGAGIVSRAAQGKHDLERARSWADRLLVACGWCSADVVQETSEESFPASDPPSWTSAAGGRATT